MGLTLQDFYTFLIELAFCILFLIVFSSIHYSINNVKKVRKTLEQKKVARFFYFFALGAILASLSFVLSQLCAKTLGTSIGLPVIILGLIFTMSFFYSIAVQIGAIIPSIVWVIWMYSDVVGTNIDLIARLLVILAYIIVSFALYVYKEKKWIYFILGSIMLAGTIILSVAIAEDGRLAYHMFETLVGITLTFVFLGLIKGINRIFTNITNIAINTVYSDKHYLVHESLDQNFNRFIKTNNINQALVIIFNFDDTEIGDVKQTILDCFYEAFHKKEYKTLFFKTEYNKYGLVLCGKDFYINDLNQSFKGNLFVNRLEKDNLYKLQQIIETIPTKYNYEGTKYTFRFKTYVSVYGVHSYDINELINDNMFMLNNEDWTTDNVIKIFNSTMTEHISEDEINYATLSQSINLNEISVSLELVSINGYDNYFVFPRAFWLKKMLGDYKSIAKTLPPKTAHTLLRNLAIKSIELYARSEYNNKYCLIINYPWEQLNQVFYSVHNAIQKIKIFGVDPNNIIYCFDVGNIKEWPKNVLKHLTEFEDKNLKYILLNVCNSTVFNSHHPMFATLSDRLYKNDKANKVIKVAKKNNVNVLSTLNK